MPTIEEIVSGKFVEERIQQDWMHLTQEDIDKLDGDVWEHYKGRGCLCHAYEPNECGCGAWDDDYDWWYENEESDFIGDDDG